MTNSWRAIAAATVAYIGLTLIYTWPLVANLPHAVVHDPLDPILNTWILWWTTKAVPLTAQWWNAPIFIPAPGAFAFSEHLLGLAPIAAPIIAVSGSPLLAYNVTLLATYVLSGLAAYFLAYTLIQRHDAAFIAGLAFAFAPYRIAQLPHIQVLSAFWTPVCLAALHRFDRQPRVGWAALAAIAWLMQGLSNGYFLFFLSVLVALWFAWFAPGRWPRRMLVEAIACFVGAAVLIAPFLLGYKHILADTYGFSRGIGDARAFGADIVSLLEASTDLWLWGWVRVVQKPEAELFPGLTLFLLVLFALIGRPASGDAPEEGTTRRWIARGLAVLTLLFGAAALLAVVFGRLHLSILGLQLGSIRRVDKPLAVAVFSGLAWFCTRPTIVTAWRSRSTLAFYAIAAFVTWIFALGPSPQFLGRRALYQAPYALLAFVPGFEGLRVPARFWVMCLACLSVLAAFGIDRAQGRKRRIVMCLAALGLLLDGWPKAFPLRAEPEIRPAPAGVAVRLDLPMTDVGNAVALLQQMHDGVPLYNGYSGYEAPQQFPMRELLDAGDARILQALTQRGSVGVVIDHAADGEGIARRLVSGYPGAVVTETRDGWSSYRLPANAGGDLIPDAAGQPVSIKAVAAHPKEGDARFAVDGDFTTRWSGGPQRQPAEFTAELDQPSAVHQIVVALGKSVGDYPTRLDIDVSIDGQAWQTAWTGGTALEAYYGALRHPREVPLVFQIDRPGVRFIRLRQSGVRKVDWSIAELRVLR